MAEILLVDDNETIRDGLRVYLEGDSHVVRTAGTGSDALREFGLKCPDLILLDVMLPDRSGFDVCREVRKENEHVPILFLSARGDTTNKVLGLGLGADDYMGKPVDFCELGARVQSLLRRTQISATLPGDLALTFHFGSGEVRGRELLFVNERGQRIDLSLREYQVLRFFAANPDKVLQRRELMDYGWGRGYIVYTRTLDTHIYNLRRKTKGCGWTIETVVNCGYRLRTSPSVEV